MLLSILPLAGPGILLLAALAATRRPSRALRWGEGAAWLAFATALLTVPLWLIHGAMSSPTLGWADLAFGVRIDWVSVVMLNLVAFVGAIVLRYTRRYLDGEPGHARFVALLCGVLAAVLLMVQADTLLQLAVGWMATSHLLQRLLLFYPERPAARRAAKKKWLVARGSDFALISALLLLAWIFDTGVISEILAAAGSAAGGETQPWLTTAVALLALAAVLKSAQFPLHAWLVEVMETPTPVSALLHAGLINAGGFLLVRFADVLLLAPVVLLAVAVVGALTAILAGMVMLTQSAVKTALAWSTVAQMGFMILQCGLALFPLALLHIVAHSLYKAHAFLRAGDAVREVEGSTFAAPAWGDARTAGDSVTVVIVGGAGLLLFYVAVVLPLGAYFEQPPQLLALMAVPVFAAMAWLSGPSPDAASKRSWGFLLMRVIGVLAAYLLFHVLAVSGARDTLPAPPPPGLAELLLMALLVVAFLTLSLLQATLPRWSRHPRARAWRVHLVNGFYVNACFDRVLAGWRQVDRRQGGES